MARRAAAHGSCSGLSACRASSDSRGLALSLRLRSSTSSFASLACLDTSRSWRRVCSSSVILCALRSETLEF